MKIKTSLILSIFFSFYFFSVKAQETEIPKTIQAFDIAIGAGDGIYSAGLSWNRTHGLLKSSKLRLGYGLRFSSFSGTNLQYITAPAKLTANEQTIDTLLINSPLNLGLNASIHIEYMFTPRLKGGFNIDAIGISFGSESATTFISTAHAGNFPVNPTARPTPFNVLLVGDNDIGYLKSEFFVAYAISEKFWIRGGLDMTFSEYTTEVKLAHENDRFRYKAMMFFLGLSFNPFL